TRAVTATALALALAAPAGCAGHDSGTIAIGLTTAPGATLLDRVVRLRLTFTNPRQVIAGHRTAPGFDLSLDPDATGTTPAPAGRFSEISELPQYARAGRAAVPIGTDSYLITGAPSIQLAAAKISEPDGIAAISSGAAVTGADRAVTAILVDDATGDLRRLR